jgi:solute carrier family 25 carnitine/acylcarnitine transporter 20/29
MTHNERRTHWFKEGLIGLGVGILYGTTNIAVGHPFDTIKTKMQAQVGFEKTNMFQSFAKTLRSQGIRGLYRYGRKVIRCRQIIISLLSRGCIPPLWGSGIYRSTQFAVFEAV